MPCCIAQVVKDKQDEKTPFSKTYTHHRPGVSSRGREHSEGGTIQEPSYVPRQSFQTTFVSRLFLSPCAQNNLSCAHCLIIKPLGGKAERLDQPSLPELPLPDSEVTLMLLLALWTSVQMPNATSARMMKSTMMIMAMTSFFLTIVSGEGGDHALDTVEGLCKDIQKVGPDRAADQDGADGVAENRRSSLVVMVRLARLGLVRSIERNAELS